MSVNIASILTEWTEIMRFQIIIRKSVAAKKCTAFLSQSGHVFFEIFYSIGFALQKRTGFSGTQGCNLLVNLQQAWNTDKCFFAAFFQIMLHLGLTPAVFSHNNIILKIL